MPDHVAEFQTLLAEVRKQLLAAQTHLDILEALFTPAVAPEVAPVLNRYVGFFTPTRSAHIISFIIKAYNVVDKDQRAPSLYRVFRMIDEHPDLAPGVDMRNLRGRVNKHNELLRRIHELRRKRAAHWDTHVSKPLDEVKFDECRVLTRKAKYGPSNIERASTCSILLTT